MSKFYEQSMLDFVGWVAKKYCYGASVLLPVGNFALPDDKVFNISKRYNHTKDHCYEDGKGYWLDTQINFFTADTEDKAKKLVYPVLSFIKFLNDNNINTPQITNTNYFVNNMKGDDELKYFTYTLINLYFSYLSMKKLCSYDIYLKRHYTAGYIKDMFGNQCSLCGEKLPEIDPKSENYSPHQSQRAYFQLHHIVPLSQNGKDEIDNFILLCPNCHAKIHLGVTPFSREMLFEISKKVREKYEQAENGKYQGKYEEFEEELKSSDIPVIELNYPGKKHINDNSKETVKPQIAFATNEKPEANVKEEQTIINTEEKPKAVEETKTEETVKTKTGETEKPNVVEKPATTVKEVNNVEKTVSAVKEVNNVVKPANPPKTKNKKEDPWPNAKGDDIYEGYLEGFVDESQSESEVDYDEGEEEVEEEGSGNKIEFSDDILKKFGL